MCKYGGMHEKLTLSAKMIQCSVVTQDMLEYAA